MPFLKQNGTGDVDARRPRELSSQICVLCMVGRRFGRWNLSEARPRYPSAKTKALA